MANRQIPKFYDTDRIRTAARVEPDVALCNSDRVLLARGFVEGAKVIHKFGADSGIGTSFEVVSSSGTYQMPTTPQALEVVSDDPNDNGVASPIGSGAEKVRVYGITDWSGGEVTEEITLNGTSAVPTVNSWLRVYRMKVTDSGTYGTLATPSHNSTITIRAAGAGATWAVITAQSNFGLGQSEIGAYTVPTGKLAFIPSMEIFVEATKKADIVLFVRENADVITPPYESIQAKEILRSVEGELIIAPYTPLGPFVGPCDIGFLAEASPTGTCDVEVDFEIIEFDA